jgi:L-ascorbate metabolism protein UlaG (beta-lactamase superfamily)
MDAWEDSPMEAQAKSKRPALLDRLRWLGHDSFLLTTLNGKRIFLDPFKLGSERFEPADYILISHAHFDHFSAADIERLRAPYTVVVTVPAVAKQLPGAQAIGAGEDVTLDDLTVHAVPAYNVNKFRSPGVPFHPKTPADVAGAGFVLTVDGERLYHAGDTDHVPEMADLASLRIDIALLPVSGTYVMTADEAAAAARAIRPRVAVPMHYAAIVGSTDDAHRFASLCAREGIEVEILKKS